MIHIQNGLAIYINVHNETNILTNTIPSLSIILEYYSMFD